MNRLLPSSKARRASGVPRSSGTARTSRPPLASRFASVALAALLAAGLVPATALAAPASGAADAAQSVQITVSYQVDDEFVLTPAEPIEVDSALAESYGYADAVDQAQSASALDALVAAHEALFADDFTPETCGDYLAVSGTGYVETAFGDDASAFGFAIDDEYPCDTSGEYSDWGYAGYTVAQAPIDDGSYVSFFSYEDPYYADYLTSFSLAGEKVSAIDLAPGQEAQLSLSGFMYMMGSYNEADREQRGATADIEGAQIVTVDPATGASTPVSGAVTGANGEATVSFAEEGTYYLSATCDYDETFTAIVAPWLVVTVASSDDPENPGDSDAAGWPSFRGNAENNAVTGEATPATADDAVLVWGMQVGEGWGDAPSAPIVADGWLYVMSGTTIEKRSLVTGEVAAQGAMAAAPSYGYAPPTYADGVLYAPLGNGTVQAFDAETLESLWIYRDELGGQALSAITVAEGGLYVGFWNGETSDARFVRIDAGDDDPALPDEEKGATWAIARAGGFYGAQPIVGDGIVVVGADNGARESDAEAPGAVLALDAETGAVLDEEPMAGDVRTSMVYDGQGDVVALSKAGELALLAVDGDTGEFDRLATADLDGQATSTPVVYDGRIYSACTAADGATGRIAVLDAATLDELFSISLPQGRPQGSLLLSDGLLDSTGELVLYATCNNVPGGLLAVRLAPDCASADGAQVEQIYDPTADGAAQYCVSSPIAADGGLVIFKNDSGRLFAVGDEAVWADVARGNRLASELTDLEFPDGGVHWVRLEGWIQQALARGLVTGYVDGDTQEPTGLFGPEDVLTRGQAATLIYRFANPDSQATSDPESYVPSSGRFSDLPDEPYYYNAAIEWCASEGIVGGYDTPEGEPTGLFGPEDPLTREQLAKMLAGLARVMGVDIAADEGVLSAFPDGDAATPFAVPYLAWCVEEGVLSGSKTTGELLPGGAATRAMAVKMLVATIGVIEG